VVSGRVEGMRPRGSSLEWTFACCAAFRFTRTVLSSLENQFGITDFKKTFMRALSSRRCESCFGSSSGRTQWAQVECAHAVAFRRRSGARFLFPLRWNNYVGTDYSWRKHLLSTTIPLQITRHAGEVRVCRSHIIKFFLCKGVQFNQLICNASQNQKMHVVVHRQSHRYLASSHFRVIVDGLSSLFAERIGCLLLASLVYSRALSDAIIVALPHHIGVSREAKKTLDCLPAVSLAIFSKADATRHT
jgi:hypothetical protein